MSPLLPPWVSGSSVAWPQLGLAWLRPGPPCRQATATVVPLLSHDAVSGALRLLSTGDVHQARNLLRHDDALTVAALCRLWCEARARPGSLWDGMPGF